MLRSLKFSDLYPQMDHQTLVINERIRRAQMRKDLRQQWERFLILLGDGLFQANTSTMQKVHDIYNHDEDVNQRYMVLPKTLTNECRLISDYHGETREEKTDAFVTEMMKDINDITMLNDEEDITTGLTETTMITLTNKMVTFLLFTFTYTHDYLCYVEVNKLNAKALDIYNAKMEPTINSIDEICTKDHHGRSTADHIQRISTETLNRHEHRHQPHAIRLPFL